MQTRSTNALKLFVAAATLAVGISAHAQSRGAHAGHGHGEFEVCDLVPQTNLTFPERGTHPAGMSQSRFNQVIDAAQKTYEPIFRHYGLRLMIRGLWRDNTVNAVAYPGQWPLEIAMEKKVEVKDVDTRIRRVDMFGGLARHPEMTMDSLLMVTCHELGHHVGGLPAKIDEEGWAVANEGQSDYFAATKCMRKVLEKFNNVDVVRRMDVDPLVRRGCMAMHTEANEQAICIRTSMAGRALAQTLSSLKNTGRVAFNTPDRSVADMTDNKHPAAQCRLDTYFQGALCRVSHETPMTYENPLEGACVPDRSGNKIGARPACWFNPRLYDRPDLIRTRVRR